MPWDDEELILSDISAVDKCFVCGKEKIILPTGDFNSPILLIGDKPGDEEIEEGRAFVGPTGRVLTNELRKHGLRLRDFRATNMWIHKANKSEECFDLSIKTLLTETQDKKMIVLIGSDTVKYFTGKKVSEWNGLYTHSELLGDVFILTQPATAFHGGLGEARFGIERLSLFAKELLHDNS